MTTCAGPVSWPCSLQGTETYQHRGSGGAEVGPGSAGGCVLPLPYGKRVSGLRRPPIQHAGAVPPWHGSFLGSSFSRESYLWVLIAVVKSPQLPMPLSWSSRRGQEAPSQSSLEDEAPWGRHGFWRVSFRLHKIASRKRQQHQEKRTPMITSPYSPGSWTVCWTATTTDCARDWEVGNVFAVAGPPLCGTIVYVMPSWMGTCSRHGPWWGSCVSLAKWSPERRIVSWQTGHNTKATESHLLSVIEVIWGWVRRACDAFFL